MGGIISRALGHLPAAAAAGGRALVAKRGTGYLRELGRRGGRAKAAAWERAQRAGRPAPPAPRLTPAALFELERRRLLVRPPRPRAALQGRAARRILVWALRLRVPGLLG